MGSLMGGLLSRTHDVTLVGRTEHMLAIEQRGLEIEGESEMVCHPRTEIDMPGGSEIILLTVKAYDTKDSIPIIESAKEPNTILVSLQNGLDNHFLLAENVSRTVTGLTSWGATLLGPGRVHFSGKGDLVLGSLHGDADDAEAVREAFALAGIDSRISSHIERDIWSKAVVNACINPITSLVRRENGCLLDPSMRDMVMEVCREAVKVARSWGIHMGEQESFEKVMEVARRTSSNRSSMLQDLERGRRTEIDQITGSLVRKGEERGVDAPLNRVLWSLVRAAQV